MSEVFEGKIRRLGNSLAVIIPRDVLRNAGVGEGDIVKISLPIPRHKRLEALRRIAGVDSKARPFLRERQERV